MTTLTSTRPATPPLVTHLVDEVLRQPAVRRMTGPVVIGVRAMPQWDHGPLQVDGREVGIIPCPSQLAMRAAFAEHVTDEPASAATVLVLLTDVPESEISDDLLARFVRPRLFGLDVWQVVRARLGVRRLDPSLAEAEHRWLAEALLDVPADPTARHASLSIDRAVDLVATSVFGIDHVSIEQVLLAAASPGGLVRFDAANDQTREGISRELTARWGPVGALVLGALAAGNANEVLPLALACRAVVGSVAGSYAQAQIERITGVSSPDDAAIEALASRAELAFTELEATRPEITDDVLAHADVWARDLKAPASGASAIIPAGFEARLEALGAAISRLLSTLNATPTADDDVIAVREAVAAVNDHRAARRPWGSARAEGAVLAARLATWLATPAGSTASSLADAIAAYAHDGAWVDRARRRVFAGDTNDALAAAEQAVGVASDDRRSADNRAFAEALSRSTEHEAPGEVIGEAIPVESILERVVAPIAATTPVLLVVLDGCGLPAFLELAGQFRSRGLIEHGRGGSRAVGLAALPTVTAVSRTSLLAGRLMTGNQGDEKRELPVSPPIAKLGGPPAVVFHSADLRGEAGAALPPAVRAALSTDGPRVVAAVVNTIDDQLSRGTFTAAHRIEDLGALPWLLAGAMESGRAVIVTADHGHVLGIGTDGSGEKLGGGDGGDRWREADREPTDDEVRLVGPRVLLGKEQGILAPWHDVLRYSGWHGGYHGGATPDEALVPLSVYLPAGIEAPAGWEQVVAPPPAWWDLAVPSQSAELVAPETKPATRTRPKPAPIGQGELFTPPPAPDPAPVAAAPAAVATGQTWVDQMMTSGLYAAQLSALGRGKPTPDRVRSALLALSERGGVASYETIAAATGMPMARVAPFLAMVSRVVNVDGYAVLTADQSGGEAHLDEGLARLQFLEAP